MLACWLDLLCRALGTQGSYEVVRAYAVGLGGGGLVLDCAVQTRGFFGKLTTREKTGVFIAFGEVLTQKSASVDTRTRQKSVKLGWLGVWL